MTTIEYLSYSKPQRFLIRTGSFFTSVPRWFGRRFRAIPSKLRSAGKKLIKPFITVKDCAVHGDLKTRLSFVIMGFGHVTRHQIIRGIFYLAYEVFFILFFALFGFNYLARLGSFGQVSTIIYSDPTIGGIKVSIYPDYSFNILIYSFLTIIFMILFVYLWYVQIKDSLAIQRKGAVGIYMSDKTSLGNVLDRQYHKTLLSIPMVGLAAFTIIPILITVLIAFTNYDAYHQSPTALIDWVGLQNFGTIFGMTSGGTGGKMILKVFGDLLLWTLVWAFFATFSNYFLGMGMAILINSKTVKMKKFWRTILITTVAVPQFISLLLISSMFNSSESRGIVNALLSSMGASTVPWLSDPIITKVFIIVVNTWVGIPYTMLITSGILMNIPDDLYESARIDGAGPLKTFTKITLPYMLFVTGPYLISQFVGNINNFNVIFLLSGGEPMYVFTSTVPDQVFGVGRTDLLITWIYKLTFGNGAKAYYNLASVLGIIIFAIIAFFSLIFYGRSSAVKNEEDFQ